ncbi:MAG: peptidase C45 [Acidobacteria bacterium]|nr:peptidase C45 [Acidobacteriota bacterium]
MPKPRILLATATLIACAAALLWASASRPDDNTQRVPSVPPRARTPDARLLGDAARFEQGRWTYVHLQGSPRQIGYQHGFLLAAEIQDAFQAMRDYDTHRTKRNWDFYRQTARDILWPHIEPEYRDELNGIVEGLHAAGGKLDLYDLVALNAFEEVPDYYVPTLNRKEQRANAPHLSAPGNCSAFVATGSYTRDHKIVIAHNNWTSFIDGARWRIVFDIVPERGNRMVMDGFPGVIASDDDFGINSNGLLVTETTITQFNGFDPKGKPEFVRARKALQYANSIDDYVRIMLDGNNGGYANDWLLGDNKTGEIARFELGLKDHRVWRTRDGYYVGSNFPSDPKLTREETDFDSSDMSSSPNARRVRWEQLMAQYKGQIDVELAQRFLGDHYDSFQKKEEANERTLCGHLENSPRGAKVWDEPPFAPDGAVQGKVTDSDLARQMSFWARRGHPCGTDFIKDQFLKEHPEFAWEAPMLTDMQAGPWTLFRAGQKAPE